MAKLVIGTNKTVGVPAVIKVVEVPPVEPYPLLSRVKDDSNNEIGTVCGYHTDANNQKYAVVCLDAQYRADYLQWMSTREVVTGLATINDASVWECTDTATSNSTKILDFVTANGYTSTSVSHCRSKYFVIEGTTYYGQLPNIVEVVYMFMHRTEINTNDTSASQYSSLIIPTNRMVWSSTQASQYAAWVFSSGYASNGGSKNDYQFVAPVLEIPINE